MGIGTKSIDFPLLGATEEAKLKRFLETASEFMDAEIETELMTVVVAKVDESRKDVVTVLTRVQAAQKKKILAENKKKK